jgi:Fic family protein
MDTENEKLKTLVARHSSLWNEFHEKLQISWIYHDHGLEGTVLQPREITVALNNKVASDSSFLPMYQEIKNYYNGIQLIRDLVDGERSGEDITTTLILELYEVLAKDLRGVQAEGELRNDDGRYGAYYHKCCPSEEVKQGMEKLLKRINLFSANLVHPLVMIARFHYDFMQLMPVGKLSGKVGRLLMNLLLLRQSYTPAIIHAVERARYYESLASEDEDQLVLILSESVGSTVESATRYIEEGVEERRRKREARKAVKQSKEAARQLESKTEVAKKTRRRASRRVTASKKVKQVSSGRR